MKKKHRPFRFLAAWTLHENFHEVVKEAWANNENWTSALEKFYPLIKDWNKKVFGNIHARKVKLQNRLNGLNIAISRKPSAYLRKIQFEVWKEYEKVLNEEESIWRQKSRHQWVVQGDRNTRFFHISTLVRRKRNKIEGLKNEEGEWIFEDETLQKMTTEYFGELYREVNSNFVPLELKGCFPVLDPNAYLSFVRPISEEDIKSAVFAMGHLKAPGPDGMNPLFFQHQWDTIKSSLCRFMVGWNLARNTNSLWSLTLKAKYACGNGILPSVEPRNNGSRLWKGICNNWRSILNGCEWRVGNGRSIKFWTDKWIPGCDSLINHVKVSLPDAEIAKNVDQFVTASGDWRWDSFEYLIPDNLCMKIASILPPNEQGKEDTLAWKGIGDGNFSVKSAYSMMKDVPRSEQRKIWSDIWKWRGPEKVRCFLWLCRHDRIMTNVNRKKRKLAVSDQCSKCPLVTETTLHAIRDCSLAKPIWMRLVRSECWVEFFGLRLEEWFDLNFQKSFGKPGSDWELIFGLTTWMIWKRRNEFIFSNTQMRDEDCLQIICHQVDLCKGAWEIYKKGRKEKPQKRDKFIRWEPPDTGFVKINVDGSCKEDGYGPASCGGLARDEHGVFICGFSAYLGVCSTIHAELWGMLKGLEMAWSLELKKVQLESDSRLAIELIEDPPGEAHPNQALDKDRVGSGSVRMTSR
ncbi:putative ribonuclease H protein At1g65750 family [Senna tora]|uniref:Putative ribonuclease H protein At1g65750 family n=1 Tax=Senna tora TaxID=362788 RepID=A0A834SMP1_9FABA|nr:putative ribonuclease H protein At1g65750 family [Senna tora]